MLPLIQLAPVSGGFVSVRFWGVFLLKNQPLARRTTQRVLWKAEQNIFTNPRSQVHVFANYLNGVGALEGQYTIPLGEIHPVSERLQAACAVAGKANFQLALHNEVVVSVGGLELIFQCISGVN